MSADAELKPIKFRTNPNFLMREIGGDCVLVPVGDAGVFENSVLSLNASCSFLWKQFESPSTVEEAVRAAVEAFDGPEEEITQGVLQFVREYVYYNLLLEE